MNQKIKTLNLTSASIRSMIDHAEKKFNLAITQEDIRYWLKRVSELKKMIC